MRPVAARLRQRSLAGRWVAGGSFLVVRPPVSPATTGVALVGGSADPADARTVAVRWLLETAAMAGPVRRTVLGADAERRSGPKHSWPGRPSPDADGTMAPDVSPAGGSRPVLATSPPAMADATGRGGV